MGWSRAAHLRGDEVAIARHAPAVVSFEKAGAIEHVEDITLSEKRFTAQEIALHARYEDRLWIVVEKWVYDVTEFIEVHPGGPEVFEQFAARDCSWQFWRWHSRKHLEAWAPSLRIGQVEGQPPPNPYREPPRWVKTS